MKHDLSRVAHSGDRGILKELQKRGDPLSTARHTIVFFQVGPESGRSPEAVISALSVRATQSGWRVGGMDAKGLTIEMERPADPDSVNALSETMTAWGTEFGATYDGWECAVCDPEE